MIPILMEEVQLPQCVGCKAWISLLLAVTSAADGTTCVYLAGDSKVVCNNIW